MYRSFSSGIFILKGLVLPASFVYNGFKIRMFYGNKQKGQYL